MFGEIQRIVNLLAFFRPTTKFGALMKGKSFLSSCRSWRIGCFFHVHLSLVSLKWFVEKLQTIAILNTKNPFFFKSVKPEVDRKTTSGFSFLRFSRYNRNATSITLVQTCKQNGKTLNWKLGWFLTFLEYENMKKDDSRIP